MNQITRPPFVGQTDGNWTWDGSRWVCNSGCDDGGFPPFGPPVFSGPAGQPPWYPGANGGVSFGQTFPANPVRGHLFYDGTTLWLFDGAAWVGFLVDVPAIPPTPGPGPSPGAGVYSVTTFTTPGTFSFTIPSNSLLTTTYKFHLQAGGGGGGGTPTGSTYAAQGGGGGEYMQVAWVGPPAGTVVQCTVGTPGSAGPTSGKGGNGGNSSIVVANTNTTIVANGGHGGWGGPPSGTNNSTEGTGGENGVFTPGTGNIFLVLDVPGGDAHLPSPSDWGDPGANSFMGSGQPGFDNSVGWNDTTKAQGYGAGGRGGFNPPQAGGPGMSGVVIVERMGA